MNYTELKKLLIAGNDMGEKKADEIVEQVQNSTFDPESDPIAAVIIKAADSDDWDYLDYAVQQLKAAQKIKNLFPDSYAMPVLLDTDNKVYIHTPREGYRLPGGRRENENWNSQYDDLRDK